MFFIVAYKMYIFFPYKLCVCVCYLTTVYRSSDYWNLLINPTPPLHKRTHFHSDILNFFNIVTLKAHH